MIVERDTFEQVLDGFSSIINDIEDETLQSNLTDIHDSLYIIWEEGIDLEALEDVKGENELLRSLLAEVLSYEQKRYVRIKYDIDVDDRATGYII